jgi:hypothetical protein
MITSVKNHQLFTTINIHLRLSAPQGTNQSFCGEVELRSSHLLSRSSMLDPSSQPSTYTYHFYSFFHSSLIPGIQSLYHWQFLLHKTLSSCHGSQEGFPDYFKDHHNSSLLGPLLWFPSPAWIILSILSTVV